MSFSILASTTRPGSLSGSNFWNGSQVFNGGPTWTTAGWLRSITINSARAIGFDGGSKWFGFGSSSGSLFAWFTDSGTSSTPSSAWMTVTPGNGILFPYGVNFGQTTFTVYEEGTWTPGLQIGGATVGLTTSQNRGTYTRIGNTVRCEFVIQLSAKGSSTGAITIQGLPYPVNSSYYGGLSLSYYENFSGVSNLGGYCDLNSSAVRLVQGGSTPLTEANLTNTSILYGVITYRV
jgi:hypothetical protein